MRVLIIRLSSIGDVVHTTPMAAALIEAGHEVGWAVEPPAAPLVQSIRGLHRTFVLPKASAYDWNDRFRLARALRDYRPDLSIDAQGLWKSAFWTWLSGAPRRIGWIADQRRESSSSVMLTDTVPCMPDDVHVIDQHLALLAAIGLESHGARSFPFVLPAEARDMAAQFRATSPLPLALISPGGGWANKLYPASLWGEVARGLLALNVTPVVVWGPGEEALAAQVAAASRGAARIAPMTGILELAALAAEARIFLAADTGPLHIAGAMGTPLVALFGPTDPARNGPWSPEDVVVRKAPPCAPCHKRDCVVHEHIMSRIPVGEVLQAAASRLASSEARAAS